MHKYLKLLLVVYIVFYSFVLSACSKNNYYVWSSRIGANGVETKLCLNEIECEGKILINIKMYYCHTLENSNDREIFAKYKYEIKCTNTSKSGETVLYDTYILGEDFVSDENFTKSSGSIFWEPTFNNYEEYMYELIDNEEYGTIVYELFIHTEDMVDKITLKINYEYDKGKIKFSS